ncbi:MAG: TraR/DksA family transcriptional regulator [Polyangiaceae bacterium]|nr:TraR/DksA family transcriptional regulator [Polyangiaceae bacterium]
MSAPARPPVARGALDTEEPDELTPEQVDELRRLLDGRRAAIVASIGEKQSEERDVSVTREVGDEMDEASFEGTTSMASKLLERDVRLLAEIDRALAKLREGTYGACEGTGEPIGYARLRLQPWARYSVAYQEELEREQRTRGGR